MSEREPVNGATFAELFHTALSRAADEAQERFSTVVPRSYAIDFHGFGSVGERMEVSTALKKLFLDESRYFRIIDVAITRIEPSHAVAFVRISGHTPGPWEETWDPNGLGPFKVLAAEELARNE